MKQSRNNIVIKNNGEYIVANTLTRYVVQLNDTAFQEFNDYNSGDLKELSDSNIKDLQRMGFLIPDELDENALLRFLIQKERLNQTTLVSYLMYSTKCNFACLYCYERGAVLNTTMTPKILEELVQWYDYRLKYGAYKECRIILFGGEPLLFSNEFEALLSKVKLMCDNYSIELSTEIVTNGYLLSKYNIERFSKFNIKDIHVTIDGPSDIHNHLRPLKNNGETFEQVIRNLEDGCKRFRSIHFVCRVGFNRMNIHSIPSLLDMLYDKGLNKLVEIYFAPITQTQSQVLEESSFCSRNVYNEDEKIADSYIYLYHEAACRSFSIPSFITFGPCMFYSANGFVITPEGDLFKCLDMVGSQELAVGNVAQPVYFRSEYYNMVLTKKIDSCLETDCPYVPICGGGCVIDSWLRMKDYNVISCKRKLIDKVNKAIILEKFKTKTTT